MVDRKQRKVSIEGKHAFTYDYEQYKDKKTYKVFPPAWSNPFFISTLEHADRILIDVYTLRVVKKISNVSNS